MIEDLMKKIEIKGQVIEVEKFYNEDLDFCEPIINLVEPIFSFNSLKAITTANMLKDFDNLAMYIASELHVEAVVLYCKNNKTPFGIIVDDKQIFAPDSIYIDNIRVYSY